MRGLREPLLWIALASFVAFLPVPTVGIPVCASLALSIQLLMRTRLGYHARPALIVAGAAAWLSCLLQASVLALHVPHSYRAADLSLPITLLALATALSRMADVAAFEESALWLSGVRVLFLGGVVFDLAAPGTVHVIQLLACPIFAILVLRMRGEITLPSAR